MTLALASAGCNLGPKYVKPSTPAPAAFKEPLPENFKEAKGWKLGEPEADLHHGKWWELFGDPD
ncbi:MAG: RND transporter, partial [Bryobacteraceae bacterium]